MTFLTKTALWASRWPEPPLRISVKVRSAFGMTRAKSSNTFDYALLSCLSSARLDLSAEDDAVALILAECHASPYAELIKSDIPSPSNVRSARSSASRPLPPPTMGVSPVGLSAATPTKGEILVQLGTLSRRPRSVKRKTPGFAEKDRPVLAKVPKLGGSPTSSVRRSERAQSPIAEAPLSSPPPSKSAAKAKSLFGGSVEQPLAVMPITVWNPPMESVRSPPRLVEELKRKTPESKVGEDGDSLLLNTELTAGAISSILKDSDLGRSKALPDDEALALSLQGVASVSSCVLSCFHVDPALDVDFMFGAGSHSFEGSGRKGQTELKGCKNRPDL